MNPSVPSPGSSRNSVPGSGVRPVGPEKRRVGSVDEIEHDIGVVDIDAVAGEIQGAFQKSAGSVRGDAKHHLAAVLRVVAVEQQLVARHVAGLQGAVAGERKVAIHGAGAAEGAAGDNGVANLASYFPAQNWFFAAK
jgi:hypothetical protein